MFEKLFSFNTCAKVEKKLYFITNYDNALAYMDMNNNVISYLSNVSNYNQSSMLGGVDRAIVINNVIYFFGLSGSRVLAYNVECNSCMSINIGCNAKEWGNFAAITEFDSYIYVFPSYGEKVVKIDVNSHKVMFEDNLYSELFKQKDDKIFSCGCLVGNIMWLFGESYEKIIAYDLLSGEYTKYELPVFMSECIDVIWENGCFYLLDINGRVIEWNVKTGEARLLLVSENKLVPFSRLILTEEKIWVLPALGKDIYHIERAQGTTSIYHGYPEGFKYKNISGWGKYYDYCKDDDYYYLAMRLSDYMLLINRKTGKEKWIKPQLPGEEERMGVWTRNRYLFNEKTCGIETYLGMLKERRGKTDGCR